MEVHKPPQMSWQGWWAVAVTLMLAITAVALFVGSLVYWIAELT